MYRLRVVLVAVTFALLAAGTNEVAHADCVYGLAYVERQNASTVWVLGPNPCVYPTSWNHVGFVGPLDVGHGGVPDGAPKRVYVEARVPVP